MAGNRCGDWAVNNLEFGYVGLQRLNGNILHKIDHYPEDKWFEKSIALSTEWIETETGTGPWFF